MLQQLTSLRVLRLAALLILTTAHPMSANADIVLSGNAQFRGDVGDLGDPPIRAPQTYVGDVSLEPRGFVFLPQNNFDSSLIVDGGSTLFSPRGLVTFSFSTKPDTKADFLVTGVGSRIVIGGGTDRTGNIVLQGFGDFLIANGGTVTWDASNSCNGVFEVCDILIGANNPFTENFSGVTNTGIVVEGMGSLLDASNTHGGGLLVGFTLARSVDGVSDDFLVVRDGGLILSNGGDIASGWDDVSVSWDRAIHGTLRGIMLVDNGTWRIQQADGQGGTNLDIGEGHGASGLLAIINGGLVEVTGNPDADSGFFLGQTDLGVPTNGGENLLFVHGSGSLLSVDNNFFGLSGSRIANGAVSIQDSGELILDSSILLVSGKDGLDPSSFFDLIAGEPEIAVDNLVRTSEALAVVSNGSLTITDNGIIGISALIIGQTPPDAGPTQEAHVLVENGTITVINDPDLSKIPLDETVFGIPVVSNIGKGSLIIADGGVVEFQNGDFVIGVGVNDDAHVTVVGGGQLTAERVIVGWADIDTGGPGISSAETGELILDDGIVNGDVYVDNNGALRGIGTVNGTIFVDGGTVAPGFSGGTIIITGDFILGPDSELIIQVSLNPDGTINTTESDSIVVTTGTLDLSDGSVTFELGSVCDNSDECDTSLVDILTDEQVVLSVSEFFESPEEIVVASYSLTDPLGIIDDAVLDQSVEVISREKDECKKGGWMFLFRSDGTAFKDQGDCIQYVNTGK